jgi:NADPH:quinone reductase-like Zn-dependent oxidoreductase
MSQLFLTGVGNLADNVTFESDPDPKIGSTDVLVRMEAAPINPVDYLFALGWYGVQPTVPDTLGAEGVGRVVERGAETDRDLLGKRVIVLPTYAQGVWGHHVVVAASDVVVVPDGIDAEQLAMLSINPLTAYLLLTMFADLRPGDWIGQNLGNSGVGRAVIALARQRGVRTLSVVRRGDVVEELRGLGADTVLVDGDDLNAQITEALGGAHLRLVFDGAGGDVPVTLSEALQPGGSVVSYAAVATGASPSIPLSRLIFGDISHRGLWITNWVATTPRPEIERVFAELAALAADGIIHTPVEARYPLSQYRDALQHAARTSRNGKVLFTFDQ